jgi:arylsulfatase A-like enzyme
MPEQQERNDVYVPTSNVDLLPTVAQIAGVSLPDWSEGQVLPGLGGSENAERDVFVVEAKSNSSFAPLTKMTLSIIRGDFKLIYYHGYGGAYNSRYELFDLRNDPEELVDRYTDSQYASMASDMRAELLTELEAKNKPYQR